MADTKTKAREFMAILIISVDGSEPVELKLDERMVIGSAEDANILVEDADVAPQHAEVYPDEQGNCWVRDLGSPLGTLVNDRLTVFQQLKPGDELQCGRLSARFLITREIDDEAFTEPVVEYSPLPTPANAPSVEPIVTHPAPPAAAAASKPLEATAPIQVPDPTAVAAPAAPEAEANPPSLGDKKSESETVSAKSVPLGEDSKSVPPSPPSVTGVPASKTKAGSNRRRSHYLLNLFVLVVFANAVLFAACAAWFYTKTKSDLEARFSHITSAATPTVHASVGGIEDLKKEMTALRNIQEETNSKLAAAEDQSAQMTRRISDLTKQAEKRRTEPPDENTPATKGPDGSSTVLPAILGTMPVAQSELVLLKERNRLTNLADEAIATGARGPYERLWDAVEDPHLANLIHAARAEILRVQDCYINGQRVKFYGIQQHQIPVAEIFPDSSALAPAQLSDDQLIEVLHDQKQVWQTRVKAAWHLGQRRSTKVGDALVKAIKTDPMLDVVAEATFSFEQISGYHAKLFDIAPLEAWWKSYNEKTVPQKSPPASRPGEAAEIKEK